MVRGKDSSLGRGTKDKVGEGKRCVRLEDGLREETKKATAAGSELMSLAFPSPRSWSWLGRALRAAGTWWSRPPIVRVILGDAMLTVLRDSEVARP